MNLLWPVSFIAVLCICGQKEEPILEWKLRYLERVIPDGAKESLEDACDYRKHKNEFKEKLSVTAYTAGFQASLAMAASEDGAITFSEVPMNDGKIKVSVRFQRGVSSPGETQRFIREKLEASYGKEIILGNTAHAKRDRNKPGQLFEGKAVVFILVVQKTKGNIAKMVNELEDILLAPLMEEFNPHKERRNDKSLIPP